MKNILICFLITTSIAHADEDQWKQTEVYSSHFQSSILGYSTDLNTFRMSKIGDAQAVLNISGGLVDGKKKTIVKCKALESTFKYAKDSSSSVYSFDGNIYPLSAAELKQIVPQLENMPNLTQVLVRVEKNATKMASTDTSINKFVTQMNSLLGANIKSIATSGQVSLKINSVDDIVCDLVSGNLKLKFDFTSNFELAKHIREKIITADELSKVYLAVNRQLPLAKSSEASFLNGANFARSLKEETGYTIDTLGKDKFLRIASVLHDAKFEIVKNIKDDQFSQLSKDADIVKIYYTPNAHTVNVVSSVQGE